MITVTLPMPPLPFGESDWKVDAFQVARPDGIELVDGWTYAGLGAFCTRSTKEDQTGDHIFVVHLGSGHRIAAIPLSHNGVTIQRVDQALPRMTDLASITDWDFGGIHGYENMDPRLYNKALGWHQRNQPYVTLMVSQTQDSEMAQQIAMSRWGNA